MFVLIDDFGLAKPMNERHVGIKQYERQSGFGIYFVKTTQHPIKKATFILIKV
jgi:hypothetical protein